MQYGDNGSSVYLSVVVSVFRSTAVVGRSVCLPVANYCQLEVDMGKSIAVSSEFGKLTFQALSFRRCIITFAETVCLSICLYVCLFI